MPKYLSRLPRADTRRIHGERPHLLACLPLRFVPKTLRSCVISSTASRRVSDSIASPANSKRPVHSPEILKVLEQALTWRGKLTGDRVAADILAERITEIPTRPQANIQANGRSRHQGC